jgi:hypothetical protein
VIPADKDFYRKEIMGEKTDSEKTVSVADAIKTQVLVNQALINLLVDKGIFTREEFMEHFRAVKQELEDAVKSN